MHHVIQNTQDSRFPCFSALKVSKQKLGVQIDDLSFYSHMKSVTRSAFYHLKNIFKLRDLMSLRNLFMPSYPVDLITVMISLRASLRKSSNNSSVSRTQQQGLLQRPKEQIMSPHYSNTYTGPL